MRRSTEPADDKTREQQTPAVGFWYTVNNTEYKERQCTNKYNNKYINKYINQLKEDIESSDIKAREQKHQLLEFGNKTEKGKRPEYNQQ